MGDNNNKNMNPAHFEAWIRELASRMGELEVSNAQTVDFFNEAIRHLNLANPEVEDIEELEVPEEEDRPWITQEKEK